MANGGNIEVAKAFVTIVPSMEGSQAEITKELTGVTTPASEVAGKEGGEALGSALASGIGAAAATIAAAVAAATAAAVAVGKQFIEAANATAAYGDEVDKTSQKMGLSAQAYQEWDYVMKIAGTDMASMTAGVKTLTNKIADATSGSSDAAAKFAQLGISMEDLQTLSQEELFAKTIEGLQGMEEGTERAALANDLFGKSGMNLAPLLNMTAEETQDLIDKANEYGMIMGDEAVKDAAAYTDAVTTLKNTFKGLKNSLMSQFLPSLTDVMDGLSAIFAGDEGGIEMIKTGIEDLTANISAVSPQLFELAEVIVGSLIDGFGPMLPSLVSSIFTFINSAITNIAKMVPQLIPAITTGIKGVCKALLDALPLLVTALIELVEDLVLWLASDDNVTVLVDGILQLVSILATSLADALPILLPAIINIIGQIAASISSPSNVQMILNAALYIVGAVVVALTNAIPEIGGVIVKYGQNIVGNIQTFGNTITTWVNSFTSGFKSTIQIACINIYNYFVGLVNDSVGLIWGWLSNLQSYFTDAFNNVKNTVSNKVSNIVGKVQDFANDCINAITGLPGQFANIAAQILDGFLNGFKAQSGNVKRYVNEFFNDVIENTKRALKIASPSKVFAEIGAFSAEGYAMGFEDTMADVKGDMESQFDTLTTAMSAEVTANGTSADMIGESNTYNGGAVTINVYGAEGQDVNDLANVIAIKLEEMTARRSAVYG